MLTLLRNLSRRRALRTQVLRAMHSGVGLYETSFPLDQAGHETLAREVAGWCRETLAGTDRPYGLDHLTLALSLEGPDGSRSASATLPVLRPADFYDGGSALDDISAALGAWSPATVTAGKLRVVLFSWGDLTRELLPAG